MYLSLITGEQLIREVSKRQEVRAVDTHPPQIPDRRAAPRLRTLAEPVACRVTLEDGSKHRSAFLNFSDIGALLRGPLPLQVEQYIEVFVSFADTGETFALRGRVVRSQAADVGVCFC